MVTLSDKTVIEFNLDFSSRQLIVIQKGEVGVEVGRIVIPMDDLKKWGGKFKGLASFIPGLTSK
jgi:hypothetical protein